MRVGSLLNNGFAGMQKGIAEMGQQAGQVARGRNPVEGLAGVRQAAHQIAANSQSVKAADEVVGTLLDVKV